MKGVDRDPGKVSAADARRLVGLVPAVLVILVGPAILKALRRAARRANFNPTKTFRPPM